MEKGDTIKIGRERKTENWIKSSSENFVHKFSQQVIEELFPWNYFDYFSLLLFFAWKTRAQIH